MLQTLDVALGLSFIFFLFSVLVSTTSEMILSWSNARGKTLWKALAHLLPQSGHGKDAEPLKDFVQHPLMTGMHRHTSANASVAKHFPSYLSSGQFGQVLMDLLESKGTEAQAETRWEQVQKGISQLPADSRGALQALSRDAERNLLPGQEPMSVFQFLAGQWFDSMMDRTTGWYKRLTQVWNFGLGLALAIACNLNVVAMTRALSTNDDLRAAFVQRAEASVKAQSDLIVKMGVEESAGARAEFDKAVTELSDAGFPVGWNKTTALAWATHPLSTFFESLLGWLMAGAAAALGAQFWFDLMKKIINLRGAGAKPDATATVPTGEAGMTGPIPPAGLIIDSTESRQG
ncbi:hypothetical protein [Prosthecobacter sp.]|uniref:hypothetical protein n=1 Tax=Prosthecobacter sp. TaxID=1965333 RepID=UPI001D79EAE9|nr:hypothetical protein [Prosthecobacter sp.]MCB1277221.1 hypothetical protein [Prosthecobacter sp.]